MTQQHEYKFIQMGCLVWLVYSLFTYCQPTESVYSIKQVLPIKQLWFSYANF